MMKNNLTQFAVVREDPQIELKIVEEFGFERAALIGSGGCTAFCLKALKPAMKITLIEPNRAQIELIKEKISVLKTKNQNLIFERFGIGGRNPNSLIEGGNFESLFRSFRLFINEFIASEDEMIGAFQNNSTNFWREVFTNRYWTTAFDLFFSDSLLTAMFTTAAIQHAPANSYPRYFQNVLEKGLTRNDATTNYFLHHIFLGFYFNQPDALPFYLNCLPENLDFCFFQDSTQNYHGFDGAQLVHFSNIFDWCAETEVEKIARHAAESLGKNSVVVYRQLNNQKNYRPLFGEKFRWLDTFELLEKDRSLFYENIEIGEKIL